MGNKVLIICFHYPPSIHANPYPTESWSKYLKNFNWEAIILTCLLPNTSKLETANNCVIHRIPFEPYFHSLQTLHARMRKNPVLFRLLNFYLLNFMLYPDDKAGWIKPAVAYAIPLIEKYKISALLSVGSPWSDHYVASIIKRKTGIPWIADYRDPWTQRTSLKVKARWLMLFTISRLLEKQILKRSCACMHASPVWARKLSILLDKRVHFIPNGFDPSDFNEDSLLNLQTKTLIISYVGTLHFHQKLDVFLKGFEIFASLLGLTKDDCELRFTGSPKVALIDQKYPGVLKYVRCIPYVSKSEAIGFMKNSHILLLFQNEDAGWYPTKVFEYLAAGRPVLATPDNGGVINTLLAETGGGIVLNEPDAVAGWLTQQFHSLRKHGKTSYHPRAEAIRKYSRVELTGKLAEVLSRYGR